MDGVDAFDSWEGYRSFVEETQRALYEDLRTAHESDGPAFEAGEGALVPGFGLGSASDAAEPPYRWRRPTVYDKFQSRERPFFHDDGVRNQFYADSQYPEEGPYREAAFFGCDNETLVGEDGEPDDGLAIRPPDDDRYLEYVWEAPWWASGCELLLDTVTAMTVLLDDLDPAVAEELCEHLGEADESDELAARMFRDLVLDPAESDFSDPSFVPEALDRIGEAYDDLAVLTVWGTADRELAVPDDSLPDGQAQPRSWRVSPEPALSGLEWTLSEGEGTAVVTVDREHEVITPAFQRVTPFRRGTVEECDEGFPAEPGEEVVVAAANVIEAAGDDRGPDGTTERQREVLAAAEDDPAEISDEQVDLLAAWATTGEPGPRERSVEALGRIAIEADTEGRPIEILAEAIDDPEASVRTAALSSLETVASDDPTRVTDVVEQLVDAVDDEDPAVSSTAADALSTVADEDPELLVAYDDALSAHLASVVSHVPRSLLETLSAVDAAGGDIGEEALGIIVELAGTSEDLATPAMSILDRAEPGTAAYEALVEGIKPVLTGDSVYGYHPPAVLGGIGYDHRVAVGGGVELLASERANELDLRNHKEMVWTLATDPELAHAHLEALRTLADSSGRLDRAATVALATAGEARLAPATVEAITGADCRRDHRRVALVDAAEQIGTADPELFADNDGIVWLARTAYEDDAEDVRTAARDTLGAVAEAGPDAFMSVAASISARHPALADQIGSDDSLPPAVRVAFGGI